MTKWREVLFIHPAAEDFPRLSESEFKVVAADIKAHGLQVPVKVWKVAHGLELLDGISRLDALEMNGVELVKDGKLQKTYPKKVKEGGRLRERRFAFYEIVNLEKLGIDPVDYINSMNEHRRHQIPESREQTRAKIEARIKADPEKSDRQHAKESGASPTTVGSARKRLEKKGDVSKLDTSTDSKGRKQPRNRSKPTKPAKPKTPPPEQQGAGKPNGQVGQIERPIEEVRAEMAALGEQAKAPETANETAEAAPIDASTASLPAGPDDTDQLSQTPEQRVAAASAKALAEFTFACQTCLPKITAEADRQKARLLVSKLTGVKVMEAA